MRWEILKKRQNMVSIVGQGKMKVLRTSITDLINENQICDNFHFHFTNGQSRSISLPSFTTSFAIFEEILTEII